ncbi:hypothetical protein NDU88_006411 [Pleurodeles waltl]|uniref:Uncharacterized protein n=1 Tax=Pleurodeles waltl TaxID=8319 RepID=A0AAV7SPJ1_PLEWA|nr:hypothetical protein NDU88_006411 [Pleurodeles waltl]
MKVEDSKKFGKMNRAGQARTEQDNGQANSCLAPKKACPLDAASEEEDDFTIRDVVRFRAFDQPPKHSSEVSDSAMISQCIPAIRGESEHYRKE